MHSFYKCGYSILSIVLVTIITPVCADETFQGPPADQFEGDVFEAPEAASPVILPGTAEPNIAPQYAERESMPLPRGNSQATQPGAGGVAPAVVSWWNGPEAKVVLLLMVLISAAVLISKYGPSRGIGGRITGGARPSGIVQILGRFPFDRNHQLVLLECGSRILLIDQQRGRNGSGLTTLTEFTDREDIADMRARLEAASRPTNETFRQDLERSLGIYGRDGNPTSFSQSGVPDSESMETLDLTRRRPRRAVRGGE